MSTEKTEDWERELREFAGNLKLQNHVIRHGRFPIGETPQEDEAICVYCGTNADKIIQFVQNLLTQHSARLVERIRPFVERVRLDVDVIKCDCGEPYKDSDLDLSVGELEQALDQVIDIVKDNKETGRPKVYDDSWD